MVLHTLRTVGRYDLLPAPSALLELATSLRRLLAGVDPGAPVCVGRWSCFHAGGSHGDPL